MAVLWKESLATGVEEIDNQHKELFKAISNLLDACVHGKGKDEVGKVIRFLEDYVIIHFGAEEKLQQACSYPEYNFHKGLHNKFVEDFLVLKKSFIFLQRHCFKKTYLEMAGLYFRACSHSLKVETFIVFPSEDTKSPVRRPIPHTGHLHPIHFTKPCNLYCIAYYNIADRKHQRFLSCIIIR